jgi:hypothetical protein
MGAVWLLQSNPVFAQSRSARRLPPPPVLRDPSVIKDRKSNPNCSCLEINIGQKPAPPRPQQSGGRLYPATKIGNEYVFQAPRSVGPNSTNVNNPRFSTTTAGNKLYRVLIKTNNPEVLAKIKEIEPLAFIRPGESVIQAGLFQEQQQAQNRVRELANKGFNAQVIAFVASRW